MGQAVIPYPEGFAQLLRLSEAELRAELTFMAAAKLYELGRLTERSADRVVMDDLARRRCACRLGLSEVRFEPTYRFGALHSGRPDL
jgi:hypothetical protein